MSRVLLIVGTPYCGSTLTSLLLNAHPDVVSPGEFGGPDPRWHPRDYTCSCGSKLAECDFWNQVSRAARTAGVEFGTDRWDLLFNLGRTRLTRHLLSRSLRHPLLDDARDALVWRIPEYRERLLELQRRNRVLTECMLEVAQAEVLVDATKDAIRARYLLSTPGIDLRVVHLLRDAPAVVNSTLRRGGSLNAAIRTWIRTVRHVDRLFAQLPEDCRLRIRYEDLCAQPEASFRSITDLIEVAPLGFPVPFRQSEHHVIGNGMRRGSDEKIELDERWRTELPAPALRATCLATGHLRARFGYEEL